MARIKVFDTTTQSWVYADKSFGKDGESITITNIVENSEDKGNNVVTFSDGNVLNITNGSKGDKGDKPEKYVDYWTDADQEDIVQQVITALGTPVFGRVEEGNKITISTEHLAGGTYYLGYNDKDGNWVEIGQISQQTETVVDIQWVYGVKIDSSTGAETNDAQYAKSQVFPVETGVKYTIAPLSQNRFSLGIVYYDEDGNFLERVKLFDATYSGDKDDDTLDIVGPLTFIPSEKADAATFVLRGRSPTSNNSFYDRVQMTCVRG